MYLHYHKTFRSNIFSFLNFEFATELYIAVGKPVLLILILLSRYVRETLFMYVKMNLALLKCHNILGTNLDRGRGTVSVY